jgi:hypothetical protein
MTSLRKYLYFLLLPTLLLLMVGCGGSSSSDNNSVPTVSVSGTVHAGPVSGATVTVTTPAGGVVAGPVTTGSDGSYTIAIPTTALAGDLVFEASGGTFPDEAVPTATNVPLTSLSAFVAAGTMAGGANVTVDPSSTIIRKLIASGKSKAAAETAFRNAFGYTPDCSIRPTFANISTNATDMQRLAGIRAAAFSQLNKELTGDPARQFEVLQSLASDLGDDVLDGRNNGAPVVTASGTAIPEDICNRFSGALIDFQTSANNRTRMTPDRIGTPVFAKTALTPSYKVEYLPGTMAAAQGKTSFKIRLTERSSGAAAPGKSVTLFPYMYMATKSHTSPVYPVVVDNNDGTYSCTVYYVMPTMMNGVSMGVWKLTVKVGTEAADFFPTVAMSMGSTSLTKLTGINDAISTMAGPEKRTYFLFNDGLVSNSGSYSFGLFLATKENMLSFPQVTVGSQLKDASGATWTVNEIEVLVSTNLTEWLNATDIGNGRWSVSGLTGLAPGVTGKVYVKLLVNGEQKTTNGSSIAADGLNAYQTFSVIPAT